MFQRFVLTVTMLASACVLSHAESSAGAYERTDFRDETVYHAIISRFYDGDPKNNVLSWNNQEAQIEANDPEWRGDFAGLIDKLDYIKALGFTAVRINPVVQNCSARDYLGGHPSDFSSVDLRLESRTDWGADADVSFQNLIDAAHAKGLKVMLDIELQSISSYGEATLSPLFSRSNLISNQASESAALIPGDRIGSDHFDKEKNEQVQALNQYTRVANDPDNLLHHFGTNWNWDVPSRWWGQISSDNIDLNTENDAVAQHLVNAYGKFIAMGVDAFCIKNAAHIAPLTLNKQFIPQFAQLGELHKDKRLGEAPFAIFADVSHRFIGDVVYRSKPNLSPYFYTWKSADNLLDEYDGSPQWWSQQSLDDDNAQTVGPMAVCLNDQDDKSRSQNALLQSGEWHEPDHSQASGLYVIDTPMEATFTNVYNLNYLLSQDNYYNDATFNLVCVDSDNTAPSYTNCRFNADAEQWAENLSFMFTFRGIPSLFYGSEVQFQKGMTLKPSSFNVLGQTGHAYFGQYLEGEVSTSDFGEFTAEGNVALTLNSDLADHIITLNKIRAAVPALRKGQYTFDGCKSNVNYFEGPYAFKRAWQDSYALVAVNGGATFRNLPAGTYTDIVTGQTYSAKEGGVITVDVPSSKGQLRVLVKDWTDGPVVDGDHKFIFSESPASKGGSVEFTDPGTSQYFTADDAVITPSNSITIYAEWPADVTKRNIYVWTDAKSQLSAAWPGDEMTETTVINGRTFYFKTYKADALNVIFSSGDDQTGDIKGLTKDTYYSLAVNNGITATELDPGSFTGIHVIETEADAAAAPVFFNLRGVRVKSPVRGGIYLMRQNGRTYKIAL